ncbi:hypothetical protein ACLUXQ_06975 [Limosilactobacillus mucosae]|jgi:cytoskeletal protein RodZ|uniref:Uncharacterized protein n=1 Tax=Limosilactobacillus mucosae TaxID=97478 RepID=A0AAJ1M9V1_LIMMU|nr:MULTISPECIES: hypothetical protein [Lactobacillaceae]MDD6865141.1 hypothetical protein [Lactobacillus sp.]MDC2829000.1 hypothetical protein [Limosilactobacillus mucosae]MDC2836421.1 hypothetical protein [Limosilactobacillus mucosae]MDC2848467.1 hypothetical protein [Limosilactobacillus mucosae]MDC2852707.1 hypothetical protein [Limosilactobacillus mucosae]
MLFWLLRHGWLILPFVFVFPLPDGPHKKFWLLIELLGLIIIIILLIWWWQTTGKAAV